MSKYLKEPWVEHSAGLTSCCNCSLTHAHAAVVGRQVVMHENVQAGGRQRGLDVVGQQAVLEDAAGQGHGVEAMGARQGGGGVRSGGAEGGMEGGGDLGC